MTTLLIAPTADETLLSYGLGVHPDPLQAGQRAALVLVVSNAGGDAVTCSTIVLTLPAGTAATDLIVGGSAIDTSPAEGWSAEAVGGAITFTAPGGGAVISGAGLAFTAAVTINPQPGTATIMLEETASDEDDPSQARSASFAVDKFPADFSLGDLSAVPADALDIAYGQPAHLDWTATGATVSCTLDYQPADQGAPVSQSVPNVAPGGSFATQPLTRSEGVVFTLRARVVVLGRDNPLVVQRQLAVSVEALSLSVLLEPPRVGRGGLTRLSWTAPNADHCLLQDGSTLAASGHRYFVMSETRLFTVTAVGGGGQRVQQQATVTVDPSIVATEAGHDVTGNTGGTGSAGFAITVRSEFGSHTMVTPAGNGGQGGEAGLQIALPPLDSSGQSGRVIPIVLTGGDGGTGGNATGTVAGNGGPGGNAVLTASWDPSQTPPAQYLITMSAGRGGSGGHDPYGTGGQGGPGTVTATIDGQSAYFL